MKNYFLLTALMLMSGLIFAQNESSDVDMAEHKIVFQLTSGDTNVHKMLVRQLGNVLTAKVSELKGKGIDFVVCENTLKEKKVTKEEIIPEAAFVKAGIIEIVKKQEEGWSYIRAGQ